MSVWSPGCQRGCRRCNKGIRSTLLALLSARPPPRDGDDLWADRGKRALVPVAELLLDGEASVGKKFGERGHPKEPQRAPAHTWRVPTVAGVCRPEAHQIPLKRHPHLIPDAYDRAVGVGHLSGVFRGPPFPSAHQWVACLKYEASVVGQRRPDRGQRGAQ